MASYELGMALNYANTWGIVEAVREFFQNAMDAEIENPENKMFYEYNEDTEVLSIGNKKSKLTPRSLLMGSSTKSGNCSTVGEHGEGYKVATVVLMRNGVTVKMYNNEAGEVWTSRVVNSRRYETKIVVFDIAKKLFNKRHNLVIELVGISKENWENIIDSNLRLQKDIGVVKESEQGRILLNPKFKGKIYVNGMYVCEKKDYLTFGYDFKPGIVKLDRDRQCLDTLDLKYLTAKLVACTNDLEFIYENRALPDCEYAWIYMSPATNIGEQFSERVYQDICKKYGAGVKPVFGYDEYNTASRAGENVCYVSYSDYRIVNMLERDYGEVNNEEDPDAQFERWCNKVVSILPEDLYEEIVNLWTKK